VTFESPLEQFVSVGAACPELRGDHRIIMKPDAEPDAILRVAARNCFWDLPEAVCKSILKVRDPVAFAASDSLFEILRKLVKHELECDDDRLSFVTLISPQVLFNHFSNTKVICIWAQKQTQQQQHHQQQQ
jgi:hypothetical protein